MSSTIAGADPGVGTLYAIAAAGLAYSFPSVRAQLAKLQDYLDNKARQTGAAMAQGKGDVVAAGNKRGYGLYRPKWHRPVVGRDGNLVVPTKGIIGTVIDDFVPGGHTFGTNHDAFVGYMVETRGVPDIVANLPSMPPVYLYSLTQEVLNAGIAYVNSLFGMDFDILFTHIHPKK